jgi:hypothetical protein
MSDRLQPNMGLSDCCDTNLVHLGWLWSISLCPQLLFGNQALHKPRSFFLVGLNALVQEHFAHLRNRPLLVFSDPLNVLP